jgi:hypothetical protein
METKNFNAEMNELFGIELLPKWHANRTMSIASKAGEPAFDIVKKGRKSGYMTDGLMVFIDRTPGVGMAIETFHPRHFYIGSKYGHQRMSYIVIFTDGGDYKITDSGVFVYKGEYTRKGITGRYFDFAGMGMNWSNKYGREAYLEAGMVVYEGMKASEQAIEFTACYNDYPSAHDFVVAVRMARIEVLKKYHEWGIPYRRDNIGTIEGMSAEQASNQARERFGIEIPASVFQRNIDGWNDDMKMLSTYDRYFIYTPCGCNDLRFDIGYNINGLKEYAA